MTQLPSHHVQSFIAGRPLAEALNAGPLVGDWLRRPLSVPSAGVGPAPLFAGDWPARYLTQARDAGLDDGSLIRLESALERLTAGEATVVVTGQQPAVLGGPLYTLYKIATCVALAERLAAEGRPAVPVFWAGDDDDDLLEAVSPVWWDALGDRLQGGGTKLKKAGRPATRVPVGDVPLSRLPSGEAALDTWGTDLGRDLETLMQRARSEDWSLARLNRAAVGRIFKDTDLIQISGHDPDLHEAGRRFYQIVGPRLTDLADLARRAGRQLEDKGRHAQISDRSLAHPLFRIENGARTPLAGFADDEAVRDLRPGVMLRSLLQDWLLQPSAVVVGPGEAGYLAQLDHLYTTLEIPRAPLVPRLFGWLRPPEVSDAVLQAFTHPKGPAPDLARTLGADLVQGTEDLVRSALVTHLGLPEDRARQLAQGRSRRWGKGVQAMLETEIAALREAAVPHHPAWVFPHGQRQERKLAAFWAAAMGGDAFIKDLIVAGSQHLDLGAAGHWREFTAQVTRSGEGDTLHD